MQCLATGDGNEVAFALEGPTGAPVTIVFLNSSFLDHGQWRLLASRLDDILETRSRFLFFEYRGFGPGKPLEGEFEFTSLATDLARVLHHNGLASRVFLASASLGTLVGMDLMQRFPAIVRGMVAWGLVPPVEPALRHASSIFTELRDMLRDAAFFTRYRGERVGPENIDILARAMWHVFVVRHSISPPNARESKPDAAYTRFLLQHMAGTSVATLESFVEFGARMHASVPVAPDGAPAGIMAVHGATDLVSLPRVASDYCRDAGIPFSLLERKGHAAHVIDRNVCDVLARALNALINNRQGTTARA